jgi:hypothetical protein
VLGALVVVGEAVRTRAERERTGLHAHHLRAPAERRLPREPAAPRRVGPALGQLQGLEHGLVVLVLVLHQHLPDEAARIQPVAPLREVGVLEHLQGPLAHLLHEQPRARVAQVGQVTSAWAGSLGSVVGVRQVGPERLEPARPLAEPEVLEGGDVPEIPDERAHERIVHAVHVRLGDGRDERRGESYARPAAAGGRFTFPK